MTPADAIDRLRQLATTRVGESPPAWLSINGWGQELSHTCGEVVKFVDGMSDIVDAASDLVLLWGQQKISGLSRSERNAAIEETREKLTKAVMEWRSAYNG